MTGKDVTECTGGDVEEIKEEDLRKRYETQCDPRCGATMLACALFDKSCSAWVKYVMPGIVLCVAH
ncbi:unnamed protein product [Discosporangium mesarthrocarpum]